MKGKTSLKISFVLIALILSISASFAYSYLATDVGFTPKAENWDVDNVSDALDDLYFNTSEYKDFDLKINELNGTYVIVEVPSNYRNNSYTYTWYLGNVPLDVNNNYSYVYDDLQLDTSYRIRVVIDTGSSKYYSFEYVHTLDRQLLYKEGNEYTYLTGGWINETVVEECSYPRGLSEKTSKYMLLYYSSNGCSMSRIRTTKSIDSTGFSKLYVKYYKYPNLGSLKYIVINDISSSYTASDWILEYIPFSNRNEPVSIHNWDSYDYFFEIYLSN